MAEKHYDILDKLGADPCAIVFETQSRIDYIVDETKRLAKAGDVLIAVRETRENAKRLLPAYINAYLRNQEKSLHSNSISLETILFLAGDMNITNAIKKVGADKQRFMLFSSRRELADELAKKCKLTKIREQNLILDADVASEVAMTAIKDYK